jgi:dynein heavy chain
MLQPAASLPSAGPPAAKSHVRLWTHEVLRVFYDRLVDDSDRNWLLAHMKEMVKKHFGFGFEDLFGHLKQGEGAEIGANEMRR